jgi:hypothetical protein
MPLPYRMTARAVNLEKRWDRSSLRRHPPRASRGQRNNLCANTMHRTRWHPEAVRTRLPPGWSQERRSEHVDRGPCTSSHLDAPSRRPNVAQDHQVRGGRGKRRHAGTTNSPTPERARNAGRTAGSVNQEASKLRTNGSTDGMTHRKPPLPELAVYASESRIPHPLCTGHRGSFDEM